MEQIFFKAIATKDKKVVRKKQHGFSKDKSYLTDLITFYDKTTCSVDKRGKQWMPLLQQSSQHRNYQIKLFYDFTYLKKLKHL